MMENQKSILIVEDELISAEYLKEILVENSYQITDIVDNAEAAIRQYKMSTPDLVLMDIMLKGSISGSEAALRIKQHDSEAKIIFLTAYATAEMLDYAVAAEAYGYLMKPYREEEILATIKLLFAHEQEGKELHSDEMIVLKNGFVYDLGNNRLMQAGEEISLGKTKLRLIEILVRNKNSSVSNEQICTFVWGSYRSDETLRSLIYRLRSIIGSEMIKNINGVGYEIVT